MGRHRVGEASQPRVRARSEYFMGLQHLFMMSGAVQFGDGLPRVAIKKTGRRPELQ